MCKDKANRAENIQVNLKCLTEMQLILSKDNANRAENIKGPLTHSSGEDLFIH